MENFTCEEAYLTHNLPFSLRKPLETKAKLVGPKCHFSQEKPQKAECPEPRKKDRGKGKSSLTLNKKV
jgi:hypothetical protein